MGNHTGADRPQGRASLAEKGAVRRCNFAGQYLSTGTAFNWHILYFTHIKFFAGIHLGISRSQFQSAARNRIPDPANAPRYGLKYSI